MLALLPYLIGACVALVFALYLALWSAWAILAVIVLLLPKPLFRRLALWCERHGLVAPRGLSFRAAARKRDRIIDPVPPFNSCASVRTYGEVTPIT